MDSYLLYKDSSTDGKKPYHSGRDIIKDLNLDVIFRYMAREDYIIDEKVRKVIMIPLTDIEDIRYRQEIINDFYVHTGVLNELYACAERHHKTLRKYKEEMIKNRTKSTRNDGEITETIKYLGLAQEEIIRVRAILRQNEDCLKAQGLKNLLIRLDNMSHERIQMKIKEMDDFLKGCEMGYTFQFGGGLKIQNAVLNYCSNAPEKKKTKQKKILICYLIVYTIKMLKILMLILCFYICKITT